VTALEVVSPLKVIAP